MTEFYNNIFMFDNNTLSNFTTVIMDPFFGSNSETTAFGLDFTETYSDYYPVWADCSYNENLSHDDRILLCGYNPNNNGCSHPNCAMDSNEATMRIFHGMLFHFVFGMCFIAASFFGFVIFNCKPRDLVKFFLTSYMSGDSGLPFLWMFYLLYHYVGKFLKFHNKNNFAPQGMISSEFRGEFFSLRQQLRRIPKPRKMRPHWTDRTPFSMFDDGPDINDDIYWYFFVYFVGYLAVLFAGCPQIVFYVLPILFVGYSLTIVFKLIFCLFPKFTKIKPHSTLDPLDDPPDLEQMMAFLGEYERIAQNLSEEVHRDWYSYVLYDIPAAAMRFWNNWRYRMIQKSVPLLIPQALPVLDSKEAAHASYEKHKKGRINMKEKRKRLKLATKKILEEVKKRKCEPHSQDSTFVEFASNLGKYVKSFESSEVDDMIRHAENVLILAYTLRKSENFSDFVVAIVSFMKMYCDKSITGTLFSMLSVLMDSDEELIDQDGVIIDPHGFSARDVLDSWELFRSNPMYNKVMYLLCAALTSSVCSIKEIDWNIAGVQLIKAEALKETANAHDLIDAIIHTYTWISETGWWCFKEKSLAPILYGDQRLRKYYEDCSEVLALADSVKSGNVPDIQEYQRKLDECLRSTAKMQSVATKSMKEILQRKYAQLVNIKQDLIAKGKNTQYRFAPMGISISGESSIGKSDIAELTMKICLRAMGFSDAKAGIITLMEADKHDNTYTTDVEGIFIDDAANVKPEFVDQAPSRKYLMFFNNVAAQAIKAELNEKGCVFINFKVGVITTNVKDLDARRYSNYPVAILRRFVHVSAQVKHKYRVPGGTSLNTDHPELVDCEDPYKIHDVWEFALEEVIPGKKGFHTLNAEIDGKMVRCDSLNVREYLLALTYLAKKHAKKQNSQVARNKHLEQAQCCPKCNLIPQFCQCELCDEELSRLRQEEEEEKELQRFYRRKADELQQEKRVTPQDTHPNNSYRGKQRRYTSTLRPHSIVEKFLWQCVLDFIHSVFKRLFGLIMPPFVYACVFGISRTIPIRELRARTERFCLHNSHSVLQFIPAFVYNSEFFQTVLKKQYYSLRGCRLFETQRWLTQSFSIACIPILYYWGPCVTFSLLVAYAFMYLFLELQMEYEYNEYCDELSNRRDTFSDYGKALRDSWQGNTIVAGVSLATISIVLLSWNAARKTAHGVKEEIQIEESKPGWFGHMMDKLGIHTKNTTVPSASIPEHVINSISNNLCWGTFNSPIFSNPISCGVFFPRKSVMLFPKHMLYDRSNMDKEMARQVDIKITRNDSPGGQFKVRISSSCCYEFPDMDLMAAFVPNCPDFKTVSQWLPDVLPEGSCMAHMLVPSRDGTKNSCNISQKFKRTGHKYVSMYGSEYKSEMARKGACMSPIISETKDPFITGFHIGGDEWNNIGISQVLTKDMLDVACEWLDVAICSLSAEATEIPHSQYGVPLITTKEVNPKALYVKNLTNDAFIEVIGSTKLRADQKSCVVPSILTNSIRDICGIPQQWGPPKLRPNWDAYNKNIEQFSNPSDMFDPELLLKAQRDWLQSMTTKLLAFKEVEPLTPLTMKETILGIHGKKYIDALPMNTGIGFPLFGKKNKVDEQGNAIHFDEIRDGEVLIDRIPKPHVQEEFDRLMECWKQGRRAYPVTTATLKDEPTKLGKEKVRVFQAAPLALSLAIRKYFLPIARFMHLNPLISESAVGINAFSPDWKVLTEYMFKYAGNDERILGWDYTFYDVRMNSQLVRAAWDCFISLAQIGGGYCEDDIAIMKNMIVDIAHPLMDINGTMLMAYNMNTSGNNMTVDVNGVVGSVLVRMGFFSLFPEKNFKENVALMTYGDDAAGSVTEECKAFEFKYFKEFLAKHGMLLTLPSKTDEDRSFLIPEEADFIKRIGNYIPEIQCEIGKLSENSIWKSLHSNLKSSAATPREVASSCIETALHEWFAFGRDHYEMRRTQMNQVAREHDLEIPALNYSFDERVAFWKEKYQGV